MGAGDEISGLHLLFQISCFAKGGGAGWNPGTDPGTLRLKGAKQEESLF